MRTTTTANPRTKLPKAFLKPLDRLRRAARPDRRGRLGGGFGPRWRANVLSRRFQGEHLAGAAGASLAPVSRPGLWWRLLLYVDHDHGDVVVAPGVEGGGEQAPRRLLRVFRGLGQDQGDPSLGDHIREPVRTQEDTVAGLYGQYGGVDIDVLV